MVGRLTWEKDFDLINLLAAAWMDTRALIDKSKLPRALEDDLLDGKTR